MLALEAEKTWRRLTGTNRSSWWCRGVGSSTANFRRPPDVNAMASLLRNTRHGERREENDLRGGPTINDLQGVGIFYTPPKNGSTRERLDFFIHNN